MRYIIRKIVRAELVDSRTGEVIETARSARGIERLYRRRRMLMHRELERMQEDAGSFLLPLR